MKLRQHTPGCQFQAYDLLREAMSWFEKPNRFVRQVTRCDPALEYLRAIIERNRLVPREEEEPINFLSSRKMSGLPVGAHHASAGWRPPAESGKAA
jgi:hypothetical protein